LNITTYNAAIIENWRGDRSAKCLELYEDVMKEGLRPNKWTYNAVVGACARSGQAKEVRINTYTKTSARARTRERASERASEREMDRQTDRQIDGQTDGQDDRWREGGR